ncbi:unnamed protein product [Orchesella dallaii]|uniref:Omega gliadin n=1 Tax=Orchesella dallaii TaxID=48710 RepID=A0ABP1QFB8_9HEXA
MKPVRSLQIFLLVIFVALVTAQKPKKDDTLAAKRYKEQEPQFQPPPLPIQRQLQVVSEPEQPASFFQQPDKIESRQFQVQQVQQQPQQQFPQPIFQQQQIQHRQLPEQTNQIQFNQQQQPQQPQQQQQTPNFQQFQQQSFQDQNNFQSRQQESLPTLPPVFIPPNQPVGPPPALQSPIRNLFKEPEPSFSLTGLLQRFLRLFNLGNNN